MRVPLTHRGLLIGPRSILDFIILLQSKWEGDGERRRGGSKEERKLLKQFEDRFVRQMVGGSVFVKPTGWVHWDVGKQHGAMLHLERTQMGGGS